MADKCTAEVVVACELTGNGAAAAESHVVEIPVDEEKQSSLPCSPAKQPLEEIADSKGHLLLLKLWQREEELIAHQMEVKESRIDSIHKEIFQLVCCYFVFNWIVLTLLFTAGSSAHTCTRWWIPCSISLITSVILICAILYKIVIRGRVHMGLQKDKANLRSVSKCIQELRMKGVSFDLSKEPQNAKRMKSSSVETRLNPLRWCSEFFVPIALSLISGLILCSSRYIVCS
ncbi:uncharacterized protein LOC131857790 [Cryptomeria japonica]|uniref:uncharacterized protein LOC131857790 n=1 Tax=Cryptomeria japonica TaxID=3369 RepID=UPI0027DA28FA|nr:uncharacterized protein LOC131857790 [Cryptomeria japonica]